MCFKSTINTNKRRTLKTISTDCFRWVEQRDPTENEREEERQNKRRKKQKERTREERQKQKKKKRKGTKRGFKTF